MDIQFKGLKIGRLIITTKATVNKTMKVSMEPKEVWETFKRALREKKIIFKK